MESTNVKKNWWSPVWNRLVMDEKSTHQRRMGNAVWLFLYFLLTANRQTGVLVRKVGTISADMGVPRRKIFKWLSTLRKGEYIKTKNSGRFLMVEINKWKPLKAGPDKAPLKCGISHFRGASLRTPESPFPTQSAAPPCSNRDSSEGPKKITMKKNMLKSDIDNKLIKNDDSPLSSFKSREELLAYDLALALDDLPGFPLYLSYSRKYPESLLRKTLGQIQEIPAGKIRNRGALYNYLIQKHNPKSPDDSGH